MTPTKNRTAISPWRRLRGLTIKELRETLRDRRTIITLVLMPLLVYPLFSLVCQKFLLSGAVSGDAAEWRIGFKSADEHQILSQLLIEGDRFVQKENNAAEKSDARTNEPSSPEEIKFFEVTDPRQAVNDGQIDLAVKILPSSATNSSLQVDVVYLSNSTQSVRLRRYVQQRVEAVNEESYRLRLQRAGEPTAPAARLSLDAIVAEGAPAVSLAGVVPLMLILMTITGAVYPAIDCTAGERERGTLETLAASPAPRVYILLAKYIAVLSVALLTASVNMLAMIVTMTSMGLSELLLGEGGFSWGVMASLFGLMMLFAAFFSAVLLCVTSFARSFKEAQAYLIPLMLMSIGPGLLSLTPGVKLSPLLAAAPLINIVLLARDVMEGGADLPLAGMTILSTIFYALAAIGVAAKVFGSDAVLYGAPGGWRELLDRPRQSKPAATVGGALLCLAVIFPLQFVSANVLSTAKGGMSLSTLMLCSAAATFVLFAGIPTFAAWRQNVRLAPGFQLQSPPWFAWPVAIVLGFSLWPAAHELIVVAHKLGLAPLSEELMNRVLESLGKWRQIPLPIILLSFGLAPALCEEWFFRGYLMKAFLSKTNAASAIFFSSILFGLFHVVVNTLAFERFLPSTILGVVLGVVCWRTQSVLPGMLLHVTHNSLLLLSAYYMEELKSWGLGVADQEHLPWHWIAISLTVATAGVALLVVATRRKTEPETSS